MSAIRVLEDWEKGLARSILGTDDNQQILENLERCVKQTLGWQACQCFMFELSVGATFGISDGRSGGARALLKVYALDVDLDAAGKRASLQTWLAEQSYPCPRVLIHPVEMNGWLFQVETFLDDGQRLDGRQPDHLKLMATGLAHLLTLTRRYPLQSTFPEFALQPQQGSVWPKPHNVLFDFAATEKGAQWIDEIGEAYCDTGVDEVLLIGHMDWSAKHFRAKDGRLTAIYDWDSTARMPESRILGGALAGFTYSHYVEGPNRPAIDEMLTFALDYVTARGGLADLSMESVVGSLLYSVGYGARCEHSIDASNGVTEARDFLRELISCDLVSLFDQRLAGAGC